MKILGIATSTNALFACLICDDSGEIRAQVVKRIALPVDDDESVRLHSLFELVRTFLAEIGPARIALLQAGRSKFGGPKPLRLKVEAVIQLAAREQRLPVAVVAPQSIRAFEKKNDPGSLAEGGEYPSKDCRDAALAAWYHFEKNVTS